MRDHMAPGVLLLEDDAADALLIEEALGRHLPQARLVRAATRQQYLDQIAGDAPIDLVLSDGSVPGCEWIEAFHLSADRDPRPRFVLVSGGGDAPDRRELQALGVSDFLCKDRLDDLASTVSRALEGPIGLDPVRLLAGYELLTDCSRRLLEADDPAAVAALAVAAARRLTGADGATFVLREGAHGHYLAEDAIGPLLLGRRLSLDDCIAGWAIRRRRPAVVDDLTDDPRMDAVPYRGSFARSLIAAPVRASRPVAAICAYWARPDAPDATGARLLQLLADGVATALANLDSQQALREGLQQRSEELDGFTYAVSHDLRAPIRHLEGFTRILLTYLNETPELDPGIRHAAGRIQDAAVHLREMVNGLLTLSRTSRAEVRRQPVDLAELARDVVLRLEHDGDPDRAGTVDFVVPDQLPVSADPKLLQLALQNLLANAWKFTGRIPQPRVEFGVQRGWDDGCDRSPDDEMVYFVRDNGSGFDPAAADRLFGAFQRLHGEEDFPGIGMGLVTAQRIITKHGGTLRATAELDQGATFRFTLPD